MIASPTHMKNRTASMDSHIKHRRTSTSNNGITPPAAAMSKYAHHPSFTTPPRQHSQHDDVIPTMLTSDELESRRRTLLLNNPKIGANHETAHLVMSTPLPSNFCFHVLIQALKILCDAEHFQLILKGLTFM